MTETPENPGTDFHACFKSTLLRRPEVYVDVENVDGSHKSAIDGIREDARKALMESQ